MTITRCLPLALAILIVSCGTKKEKANEKPLPQLASPEEPKKPEPAPTPTPIPVHQSKGPSYTSAPESIKSQYGSTLTLVPSLNIRLGQAVSGTSIFDDTDKTVLPDVCMDGTVSSEKVYGTLATPHALVTDFPGSTYRGMSVDKTTVLKLFSTQVPKEVTEFLAASEAATGRYVSTHGLHLKTHDFVLSQARILQTNDCGDRFIQKLSPASFFFFTLRFEIADEAVRTEFAAFSMSGGADEVFTHPRKSEIIEFLKAKNISLQLVALQGRDRLDEDAQQLIKNERCGAYDLEACEKTYRRLKEYQQLAFKAQFKNAPASLSELKPWGIYEFKTSDYKVHD